MNTTKIKRYILTGGPGIGKTTVISLLSSAGYTIVPETARLIIEEEQRKRSDILPWKDLQKFQDVVAERQIHLETYANGDIVFQDRSIVDGYGYSMLGGVKPHDLIEKVARERYEKIFLLDPLPDYKNDTSRIENAKEAGKIHTAIVLAYEYFDYEPITVPVMTPEERMEYILQRL